MCMGGPGEEFSRAFPVTFGPCRMDKGAVIQEKAEEIKIRRPKMFSEKKIVPQSTIEIFNDGTGAWRRPHRVEDSLLDVKKFPGEVGAEPLFLLPPDRGVFRAAF